MMCFILGESLARADQPVAPADRILMDLASVGPPPSGPWPCALPDATALMVQEYQPGYGKVWVLQAFFVCGLDGGTWQRAYVRFERKEGRQPRHILWRTDERGRFGSEAVQDLVDYLKLVRWTLPQQDTTSFWDPEVQMVLRGPNTDMEVGTHEHRIASGAVSLFGYLMGADPSQQDPVQFLVGRRSEVQMRLKELQGVVPSP